MKLAKLIEFLRERLKTVIWACVGVLIAVVLADLAFVNKEHAHTAIERVPAFWAVFGLIACVVIVIVAKWFGHAGIMTREDYYEDQGASEAGGDKR